MEKWWAKEFEEKYPDKDFAKTQFNFSAEELRMLTSFNGALLAAQVNANIANKTVEATTNIMNNFVTVDVTKRLGITVIQDTGINYDAGIGKLIVATPKNICSQCKNKKAEFSFKGQIYCGDCIDKVTKKDNAPKAIEEKEPLKEPTLEVKQEAKPNKKK